MTPTFLHTLTFGFLVSISLWTISLALAFPHPQKAALAPEEGQELPARPLSVKDEDSRTNTEENGREGREFMYHDYEEYEPPSSFRPRPAERLQFPGLPGTAINSIADCAGGVLKGQAKDKTQLVTCLTSCLAQ